MRRKGKKITKRKRIERCNGTSQTVNMPADVMKVLMDRGHDGKINIFVSPFPSFFPLCHRFRKTQTSKETKPGIRYWLPCSFTPTIEPSGYPQFTAALSLSRGLGALLLNAHPIASSPLSLTPPPPAAATFRQTSKKREGKKISREDLCLPLRLSRGKQAAFSITSQLPLRGEVLR